MQSCAWWPPRSFLLGCGSTQLTLLSRGSCESSERPLASLVAHERATTGLPSPQLRRRKRFCETPGSTTVNHTARTLSTRCFLAIYLCSTLVIMLSRVMASMPVRCASRVGSRAPTARSFCAGGEVRVQIQHSTTTHSAIATLVAAVHVQPVPARRPTRHVRLLHRAV